MKITPNTIIDQTDSRSDVPPATVTKLDMASQVPVPRDCRSFDILQ